METRIALVGIMVEDLNSVQKLNEILHEFSSYIVGRMGVPMPQKGLSVISIAVDAPQSVTSALSGKIGMLSGVTTKAIYSKN